MNLFASLPLFAELSLRGGLSPYLVVPIGVLAVGAVGALYVMEAGRLAIVPRLLMAAVRMAILATVAFLLLRPVWVREVRGESPRPVAVLIDVSASMGREDPRPLAADQWRTAVAFDLVPPDKAPPELPTSADLPADVPAHPSRLAIAQAALTNKRLNLLDRLKDVGPLDAATFGARREGKDGKTFGWVAGLKATEPQTAIGASGFELLGRDPNDPALPAALVFVTDGRENGTGRGLEDLARECAKLKVPVHVYAVGSSQFGQVQIRDAGVPNTLFVNDTVAVPVRYRVRGVKEGKALITLKLNDAEVARKEVDIKEGDDLREVLGFVPTQADARDDKKDQVLTTTVQIVGGPEPLSDSISKSVQVVDRKIKVLVIDSLPRFDFKFLQRGLLRDRRVQASFFLTDADKKAMNSGEPWVTGFPATQEELNKYDLLVLGDLPKDFLTKPQQEFVRDFVAEGGGLIHIAGRNHAGGAFLKTELDKVLPVELADAPRQPIDTGERPTPYRPQLTPAGERSQVLSLEEDPFDNKRTWRTLPELYWHFPVARLRPGAEVLLTHPRAKSEDGKPMPLLASHYYGKGYVLYVGVDETWRWRFNEAEKFFGRFWSQAVYLGGVARTVGTRLTQLSLTTPEPVKGGTGQVFARLFTKDYKPRIDAVVSATLERAGAGPNDKDRSVRVDFNLLKGQPGEYVATLPFNTEGRFSLKMNNDDDAATLDYRVGLPPEHELSPGGMAEPELRKLAADTGGAFYREEDLLKLPNGVKPQFSPFVHKEEILLWNRWPLFLLIGLLSMEWLLRKFNSLS